MRVRLEGKDGEIELDGPLLGRGGEASIYTVAGRPDLAAKIYHNPSDEHAAKLAAMLAAAPVAPPQPGQPITLAWPIARLLDIGEEGRVIGYLMPRIEKAHLIWEIYNPGVRRQVCPHFHHGALLRTARNLAAVVHAVQECGYVIGDLNESNVLVTSQAQVALIDVDSFQTPGHDRLFRCRVGRPEYTPPELQGVAFADIDRLPQHDAFALSVLIFQLLMQGIHPFSGRCTGDSEADSLAARIAAGHWPYAWLQASSIEPSPHAPPWFALPPSVQELLRRCFEDAHTEPELRPSAAQWQHALEEAEQELTTCPGDSLHLFHRKLDHCPWCGLTSAFRSPLSAVRPRKTEEEKRKTVSGTRKEVQDPLPPRFETQTVAPPPASGGAELLLQAIGASLERRVWLVWLGVALIGTVAGIVYALQRALPAQS